MDNKNKYYAVCLRLNEKNDSDIIQHLSTIKKQTYIKRLIRDDMRSQGKAVKGAY